MIKRFSMILCFASLGWAGCGGADESPEPPICEGESQAIEPLQGQFPTLISSLEIGRTEDGFDLNKDGEPDNKLGPLSSLARQAIAGAFEEFALVVPVEFFDFAQPTADSCVKFAIYLGAYRLDSDGDMAETAMADGDCHDGDATVGPGITEIADNGKDDDCDGLADEVVDASGMELPSDNADDLDQDGLSIAAGDCDDTHAMVGGLMEICGDGLDNDCDGNADYAIDADGKAVCSPYDATPDAIALNPLSFDDSGAPLIVFEQGTVRDDMGTLVLEAGPSVFALSVPLTSSISLDLRITNAIIEATVVATDSGVALDSGRLGGVIDAYSADQVRGLEISQIGLSDENSLLDAVFANVLGALLALPQAPPNQISNSCRTPDIDVDGDGLEAFCDSNPLDEVLTVDACIDGDGTVVRDEMDAQGNVVHCTESRDANGNLRFVDGISVVLKFSTTPVVLPDMLPARP